MSPRVAGILAMVVGIVLAIFGGTLFQYGWAGIVGAILIVAASILFAIGAVWILRRSWADKTWPPGTQADEATVLKRQRRAAVLLCCVAPLMIGGSIAVIALGGEFWSYLIPLGLGCVNLLTGVLSLREVRTRAAGNDGSRKDGAIESR